MCQAPPDVLRNLRARSRREEELGMESTRDPFERKEYDRTETELGFFFRKSNDHRITDSSKTRLLKTTPFSRHVLRLVTPFGRHMLDTIITQQ